jgi:hypothetical protein
MVQRKLYNHMIFEDSYYWTQNLYIWYKHNILLLCRRWPAEYKQSMHSWKVHDDASIPYTRGLPTRGPQATSLCRGPLVVLKK